MARVRCPGRYVRGSVSARVPSTTANHIYGVRGTGQFPVRGRSVAALRETARTRCYRATFIAYHSCTRLRRVCAVHVRQRNYLMKNVSGNHLHGGSPCGGKCGCLFLFLRGLAIGLLPGARALCEGTARAVSAAVVRRAQIGVVNVTEAAPGLSAGLTRSLLEMKFRVLNAVKEPRSSGLVE